MKQDKQPTTKANLRRYSHDMSFSRSWTSSTGHIIPVVHDFLNAGETIQCSIDLKTRMQPILRPAMLDVHQKIKYFFVPMDMLYSLFGAIRYQVDDYFSSAFNKNNVSRPSGFPIFDLSEFFKTPNFTFENYSLSEDGFNPKFAGETRPSENQTINNFEMFDDLRQGAHRLLDALGYDPNIVFANSDTSLSHVDYYSPSIFPYALLAYQAIYFNYFRDEDFESNDNFAFNWDSFYNSNPMSGSSRVNGLMNLRYVNRFKDFFTNIHPSPLISNASMFKQNSDGSSYFLSNANFWLGDNANENPHLAFDSEYLGANMPNISNDDFKTTGFVPSDNAVDDQSQINASQLRMLFAVDKLLTVTGRARKRVDDQILAHFGFSVPLDVKHNIQYIGEQDGSFSVGDVISTSDTASGDNGAVLGELAGKAFGRVAGQGVKKFTAPVDGVFIGVYYSMPKVRYAAGYDRKNAVADRIDLFIPEFDSLGMQPVFEYQYARQNVPSPAAIYGWQWRYEQWKRNYDSVSWAFRESSELQGGSSVVNPLSAWTPMFAPDKYFKNRYATYQALKVTPHDLDNIMVVPFHVPNVDDYSYYKERPQMFYYTDPFIHDMYVNYKKLSVMSTFSIPSLDNQI